MFLSLFALGEITVNIFKKSIKLPQQIDYKNKIIK